MSELGINVSLVALVLTGFAVSWVAGLLGRLAWNIERNQLGGDSGL